MYKSSIVYNLYFFFYVIPYNVLLQSYIFSQRHKSAMTTLPYRTTEKSFKKIQIFLKIIYNKINRIILECAKSCAMETKVGLLKLSLCYQLYLGEIKTGQNFSQEKKCTCTKNILLWLTTRELCKI